VGLDAGTEWSNLTAAINGLDNVYQERLKSENAHEGEQYIRALEQAKRDETEHLRIAREVKSEMTAKGLTV